MKKRLANLLICSIVRLVNASESQTKSHLPVDGDGSPAGAEELSALLPQDPHRWEGICNLCTECGYDFANAEVFNAHRVGSRQYDYSEERPDGRRCLTQKEMGLRGWRPNKRGRWMIPHRSARGRQIKTPNVLEASPATGGAAR
jgi:hypothetical protein